MPKMKAPISAYLDIVDKLPIAITNHLHIMDTLRSRALVAFNNFLLLLPQQRCFTHFFLKF